MHFRPMLRYALCFAAGALVVGTGHAAPLLGPKGKFSTFLYDLKYDPSRSCYKPSRPFGNDKYAWDRYQADARQYLQCIKDAATKDMDYASEVIAEGYETAVRDFLDEIDQGY